MQRSRIERITDVLIAAFLWAFRIAVIAIVVVGSTLTLLEGRFTPLTWVADSVFIEAARSR